MGTRNGDTVFDVLRNGAWKRIVRDINGQGDLGLSIPQDYVDEHGVEKSDNIVMKEDENGRLVCDFGKQ